jgi:hypothetical protein
MHLPGRLRGTTLGDLLGALHRAGSSGTLELVEGRGRTHRVHVHRGLVTAVDLDAASASLAEILRRDAATDEDTIKRSLLRALASRRLHGEVLVRDFKLAPDVLDRALRRQITLRLHVLDQLPDAQVLFRVTVRPPRGALTQDPLGPRDFLHGRKRARERFFEQPERPSRASHDAARSVAWRTLGLTPGCSDEGEIKRAYRRLVRSYHPDLHPNVSADERRRLEERFAAVTAAYQALVA